MRNVTKTTNLLPTVSLFLFFASLLPTASMATIRSTMMVGGYSDGDPSNREVVQVASFAVQALVAGECPDSKLYSFAIPPPNVVLVDSNGERIRSRDNKDTFEKSNSTDNDDDQNDVTENDSDSLVKIKVVNVQKQVVAGLNYRMTIELWSENDDECIGIFEATVWDHFGDLQVTSWGPQKICKPTKVNKDEEGS